MMNSTSTNSNYNTIIGRNACQYMAGSSCSSNVAIGNQALRDPGATATVTNNVVIGTNACRGGGIGNNVVAIGARAGYRSSSSLGTMGSHAIMIGANTCDMGNTNGYIGD